MMKPEFIARQGRRPSGLLGHVVARVMAVETRHENDRTLENLRLKDDDDVLEIGFGHGDTLNRAATLTRRGRLAGVDFSDLMLDVAARRNQCHIAKGRMDLRHADSTRLPFPNGSFDKAFSVHTIYFWPEPKCHIGEAFRVLRPGGRLVLCYRSGDDAAAVAAFPASVYHFPAVANVERDLVGCGFVNLHTATEQIASRLITWTAGEKPAMQHAGSAADRNGEIQTCA